MTAESEPWWRAEYDLCVAAYRIDDPVIDIATDRLRGGWSSGSDGGHPWDWAVTALAEEVHYRGAWTDVRRHLLRGGCSPSVVDDFEADATDYDGPFEGEGRGARRPGETSLVTAMIRRLVVEEYDRGMLEDPWDDVVLDRAIAGALEAGGDIAALAGRVVAGEIDRDEWVMDEFDARRTNSPYAWVGGIASELASPMSELEVPSAPSILEVWSRALDALPPYGSAPWVVGADMEDLIDIHSGDWWSWGRKLVPHRVQIMDAVLGTGPNVSIALSGCWVSTHVDVFDQWAGLIRRRGLTARGVTDGDGTPG